MPRLSLLSARRLTRTFTFTFMLGLIVLVPVTRAQRVSTGDAWCTGQNWGQQRGAHHCEVRTFDLGRQEALTLRASTNGGVRVYAWDRPTSELRVRVVGHAPTGEEARRLAGAVELTTGRTIRADAPEPSGRDHWTDVSFELYVPRTTDLDLQAQNGGIGIEGVAGRIRFETSNGGVRLERVGGDVQGRTTNGGLDVHLDGQRWEGPGLDLRTTNGGVRVQVPEGYNADLSVRTTNGRFDLGFPMMVQGRYGTRLETTLGTGGAPVRITTTNGGVVLRRPS